MKPPFRTVTACLLALFLTTALLTTAVATDAEQAASARAAKKTVRLLTIGNSFSQDATFYLDELAAADGNLLILKTANVGGSPLELHWNRAQIHERDPQDPAGTYSAGRGLKEILLDGPHDFVTIQQRSLSSHDMATYRPYAANLRDYVKKYAPTAELLLHETWAYRVDDPRFKVARPKPGEPRTQREMYDGLSQAYRTIAAELQVRLIPVGDAFIAADTSPQWGFQRDDRFQPKSAQPPALPDQKHSLHVGFVWKKDGTGKQVLAMDGHHASAAGRYLGACVWYEVLFETSCLSNKFVPPGIAPADARFLQETAHATVAKWRAGEVKTSSIGDSLTFAALGDIPYSEEEFPLLRRQLAELAPTLPFIFHVGDIKRSTVPFREDAYSRVADELKGSRVPVFITVGDNEYNDAADPALAWSYWKKHLGDLHNHWQHGLDVQYQPTRRENVAFLHRGVLFIMINLVGSKVHDPAEWASRMKDDSEWVVASFDRFGEQARAAVIIAHAHAHGARQPFADVFVPLAAKFARPVLYVHGDGHRWIQDQPFPAAPNVTRIQVDQGAIAPPVRITVAASGSQGAAFTFDRCLTKEYEQRRQAITKKPPTAAAPAAQNSPKALAP